MKKFLLLAALVAAFTVSAQDWTLTELTSTENIPAMSFNRYGFGMDGKFVVLDRQGYINFINPEDGSVESTLETGATNGWPAVTRDEAGNIIARVDNSFGGNFMADTVIMKIFPAGGGEPIDVEGDIFADFESENGRCDYFGIIEGNVMEEGILWIATAKSTGVLKVPFVEGEIDADHIALFPVEGATLFPSNQTTVNPYIAADGTRHYILWTRNANPVDMVINDNEDGFNGTNFSLPNKGATNCVFPFVFGQKDLVLYTTLPNYGNAWAVAEKNAEEPIASVEAVSNFVTNGFQTNCLNAEIISDTKAIIYQYFPGNFFKTYELTIGGAVEHTYAVCGAPAALFSMENDWDPVAAPEMQMNDNGLYEWTSAEVAIPACDIAFKVVQDHAWEVSFPQDNYVIPAVEAGTYTLNVTYNPETNEVNAVLTPIEQPVEPTEVYIIGEVDGNQWATNVGVKMDADEDHKIFTKEVVLDRGVNSIMPKVDEVEGNLYCYFSFATKLMEAADDWNGLAPYRFGAVSETSDINPNGDFRFYKNMMGQPLALTFNNGRAFQVEEGTYTLTVDYEAMTLTIVGQSKTAIETINVENKVKSGRFNLLGQPVNENYKGIVIENGVKKIQR